MGEKVTQVSDLSVNWRQSPDGTFSQKMDKATKYGFLWIQVKVS
jgi:hypothetical protein